MTNKGQHRGSISTIWLRAASTALAFVVVLVPAVILTQVAQAQTFSVLYDFKYIPDGAIPYGNLIQDKVGNLYGTTNSGGTTGSGTVFKLDGTGNETILHSFNWTDGGGPFAGLIQDKSGNFYGTTAGGGTFGVGVVFKLDKSGQLTVLHNFTGGADGAYPYGNLIQDTSGKLYGTTYWGGDTTCDPSGCGTVFMLDKTGTLAVLHSFVGSDGKHPYAGLLKAAGNIYGTTIAGGGTGYGTVFKLDKKNIETVLYSFTYGADGGLPYAGLVQDKAGNLYGTTVAGGTSNSGTVFKLDKTGNETVIYSFTGGTDGTQPYGTLVRDASGSLYGNTALGGMYGFGIVFKIDSTGQETVLHNFGGTDGQYPYGGLVQDEAGNLYGTTTEGGVGYGNVFKVAP